MAKLILDNGKEVSLSEETLKNITKGLNETTIDDVRKEMFENGYYFLGSNGTIYSLKKGYNLNYSNEAQTKKQLKKLLAINDLLTIAKHVNEGWEPKGDDKRWHVVPKNNYDPSWGHSNWGEIAFFKSEEAVERAKEILGMDIIKLAYSETY